MIYTRLLSLLLCLALPINGWAAVSFGIAGSATSGNPNLSIALPTGIVAGSLLVICIGNKYPTNGPPTPTGYTAPTNNQGTGDPGDGPGVDLGATYATIFYRVADGSESGNVVLTVTGGNVSAGVILRYANATGLWSVAAAQGGDSSSGSSWSATMNVDPGISGGDMVVACSGKNNDGATATVEAITTTGITYGTASERSDVGTTFNDDVGLVASDHVVTSGTSSAAPVVTWTAAANTAGGTAILRIREQASVGGGGVCNRALLGVGC